MVRILTWVISSFSDLRQINLLFGALVKVEKLMYVCKFAHFYFLRKSL